MRLRCLLLSRMLLVVAAVGCAALLAPQPAPAAGRLGRDKAMDSIVQVIVHTRFGTVRRCSGYVLSTNGKLILPYHIISDATSINVFHVDHGLLDVKAIRRIDPQADIAVLDLAHATEVPFDNTRIADSRALMPGDTVHVLSHPAYSDAVQVEATVQNIAYPRQLPQTPFTAKFANELQYLQLSGPFDVGSTGGLVCNASYEVVGLIIGGSAEGGKHAAVYAMSSNYFAPFVNSTYDLELADLRTSAKSDADYFDVFFGASPQPLEFNAAMPEPYIAWFAPIRHTEYADAEFTSEINDKIDKNWFYSIGLRLDQRPLREWSASRFVIWPATLNPWGITDSPELYVHFDADSLFTKRIYKSRDTEERIMTRYIVAFAVPPGTHVLEYENRGANFKATGVKRERLALKPAQIKLLDIQGLSFVSMKLLPNAKAGVGEGESVRYELERRPLSDKELNFGIRSGRYPLQR